MINGIPPTTLFFVHSICLPVEEWVEKILYGETFSNVAWNDLKASLNNYFFYCNFLFAFESGLVSLEDASDKINYRIETAISIMIDHTHSHQMINEKAIEFLSTPLLFCTNLRRKIIRAAVYQHPNWQESFLKVFEELRLSDAKLADYFLSDLFYSLEDLNRISWVEHCACHLKHPDWAFFMLKLNNIDFNKALIIFKNFFEKHSDAKNIFLIYLNAFARQERKDFLNIFIEHIVENDDFYPIIYEKFLEFDDKAQVHWLLGMNNSKFEYILNRYWSEMTECHQAMWINQIFTLSEFNESESRMMLFYEYIQPEKFVDLFDALEKSNTKIAPYLFRLPDPLFSLFIELISNRTDNSTFFFASMRDHNLTHLFSRIDYERIYNSNMIVCIHDVEREKNYFTLPEIYKLIEQMAKDPIYGAVYQQFIQQIPPVFIGIFFKFFRKRKTLLRLIPFFTKEQIHFLLAATSEKSFQSAIQKIFSMKAPQEFFEVWHALSPFHFKAYLTCSFYFLQKQKEKHVNFINKLFENRVYTEPLYEKIKTQIEKFKQDTHEYIKFDQYLKQIDGIEASTEIIEAISKYKNLRNQMARIRLSFSSKNICEQLTKIGERVSKNDKPEKLDLYSALPESFWLLTVAKTLPHLGISAHSTLGLTHLGQLNLVGICSSKDLELLKIFPEYAIKIQQVAKEIDKQLNNFLFCEKEIFYERWNAWTGIEVELKSLDVCKQACLSSFKKEKIKELALFLCEKLISWDILLEVDLQVLIEKREALLQKQESHNYALVLLDQEFEMIRFYSPLVSLQRYLMGKDLKETWNYFFSKKIYSINDLYEKKHLLNFADTYFLENLSFCKNRENKNKY